MEVSERVWVAAAGAAAHPIVPALDPAFAYGTEIAPDPASCAEADCLRGWLASDVIAGAEQRALAIGVGADRVLIAAGRISEETYLRLLADSLGLAFETFESRSRTHCGLDDSRLIEAVAAGIVPLTDNDESWLVVAPRGTAARRIVELVTGRPELARRLRLTSSERMADFVLRHGSAAVAARANEHLQTAWPLFSAAPSRRRVNVPVVILGLLAAATFVMAPAQTALVSEVMLAFVFLAWLALRLVGTFIDWPADSHPADLRDDELPVYTVMSALYREAASVDGLLAAIERFDYPGIMAQTPPPQISPREV